MLPATHHHAGVRVKCNRPLLACHMRRLARPKRSPLPSFASDYVLLRARTLSVIHPVTSLVYPTVVPVFWVRIRHDQAQTWHRCFQKPQRNCHDSANWNNMIGQRHTNQLAPLVLLQPIPPYQVTRRANAKDHNADERRTLPDAQPCQLRLWHRPAVMPVLDRVLGRLVAAPVNAKVRLL